MVSHSCSASLSSSYFSHTPSSSPPSSPDSAPPSSQDSFPRASSPASSSTLALVPFLWEEKPGVRKRDMHNSKEDRSNLFAETSRSVRRAPLSCRMETRAAIAGDPDVYSPTGYARTTSGPRAKMRSESVPRLRPPPCLTQPTYVHALPNTDEDVHMLRQHHHHLPRSKVMPSFPFHNRRHHKTPSIEDDPFWMAMVACTNDAGKKASHSTRRNRNRENKVQRSAESWIAKRVQGNTISFEQCMPHRTPGGTSDSHRGKCFRLPTDDACSSIRSNATHADDQQSGTDTGPCSTAHLTSKAFKALNLAKSEVHGRYKALLQQQSSPVDISCSTRLPKKFSFAAKRKTGDGFAYKD